MEGPAKTLLPPGASSVLQESDGLGADAFLLCSSTRAYGGLGVVVIATRKGACVVSLCKLPLSEHLVNHLALFQQ